MGARPGIDSTNTRHGRGVGLYVTKWGTEVLGGELAFRENELRGNLVTLHLPTCEPRSE